MNQKKTGGISSLVAAHYPAQTPWGTVARSEPPGIVVLKEDGETVLRRDDEPQQRSDGLCEFMTASLAPLAPSTCVICLEPITVQQPSDGPVPHGNGVAHESCNSAFTDKLLTDHPPRGHRPRSRGKH